MGTRTRWMLNIALAAVGVLLVVCLALGMLRASLGGSRGVRIESLAVEARLGQPFAFVTVRAPACVNAVALPPPDRNGNRLFIRATIYDAYERPARLGPEAWPWIQCSLREAMGLPRIIHSKFLVSPGLEPGTYTLTINDASTAFVVEPGP